MHAFATIAALAPFVSLINASPTPVEASVVARGSEAALPSQSTIWKNPKEGGTMNLGFYDTSVQWGMVKPSSYINNNVSTACGTNGFCDAGSYTVGSTQYITSKGEVEDLTISMTVSGTYPIWAHNGMIAALAFAMDQQTKSANACSNQQETSCDPESYCPNPVTCWNQYTAPQGVSVSLPADTSSPDAATSYMTVSFDVEVDSEGGICGDVLNGIAGFTSAFTAVPGVGGVFVLASLLCDS